MDPVKFKHANGELTAPGCGKLPIIKTKDNCIVSCWKMSEEEKKRFQETGEVWLTVIGLKHPPICMSVEKPFGMVIDGKDEEEE